MTKKQRRRMRSRLRKEQSKEEAARRQQVEQTPEPQEPDYNSGCEFCDDSGDTLRCRIRMDTFYCSRHCAFATNALGSLPPYGSKYMRGGRL